MTIEPPPGVASLRPRGPTAPSVAVLAIVAAFATPARASPLMDPSIFANDGDSLPGASIRDAIAEQSGIPAAGITGFSFTPSISLQETVTDNVNQTYTNRQGDFITQLAPSIVASAQTPRLQGSLSYTPTLSYYSATSYNNYVNQNLAGSGLATIVPDVFFIQANAFAGEVSGYGGLTGAPGTVLNQNNATMVESFSINPYFLHEFGTYGTVRVGYSLGYSATSYSGSGYSPTATGSAPIFNPNNGNQITHEETATYTSGEFLGRFQYILALDAQQFSGSTTTTSGAYSYSLNNTLNYAVNRWLTLNASLGVQSEYYNTVPATNISGVTWNFGGTVTPNEQSTIQFGYGHSNGFDSFNLNANYAFNERTSVAASYGESLGVTLQQVQNALNNAFAGPNGVLYSASNGAPLNITTNILATQTNLTRNKVFNLSGTHVWTRDTITIGLNVTTEQYVARSVNSIENSQQGILATINFNHELEPGLNVSLYADYGYQNVYDINGVIGATQVQRIYDLSAAISYSFTPTLVGNARYLFTDRVATPNSASSGVYNVNATNFNTFYQNVFTIGLVKTF